MGLAERARAKPADAMLDPKVDAQASSALFADAGFDLPLNLAQWPTPILDPGRNPNGRAWGVLAADTAALAVAVLAAAILPSAVSAAAVLSFARA